MFAYTTAFGWYSAYLLRRTGGLAVPIMAHSLCNALGVPDFSYLTLDSQRGFLRAATVAGVAAFVCLVLL
jgi:prenyl protein peptidase